MSEDGREDSLGLAHIMVIKRSGKREVLDLTQIKERLQHVFALYGLPKKPPVNLDEVWRRVCGSVVDGITTQQIDGLLVRVCGDLGMENPNYLLLGGALQLENHHNGLKFSQFIELMAATHHLHTPMAQETYSRISPRALAFIREHAPALDALVAQHDRKHWPMTIFGAQTAQQGILMTGRDAQGHPHMETMAQLMMRVCVALHEDLGAITQVYPLRMAGLISSATPICANSCATRDALASCFLLAVRGDSIDGIYDSVKEAARISQGGGGVALAASALRAKGSEIRGTGGTSSGIPAAIRIFASTCAYVDQGGNKRPGSCAVYIEPWHLDMPELIAYKEHYRTDPIFPAIWMNDLLMERCAAKQNWSFFCPDQSPGLADVCGGAFRDLYERYEREGRARKVMPAIEVLNLIATAVVKTGLFVCNKDAVNRCTFQQEGIVRSSNLCTEIVQHSGLNPVTGLWETAVCNLSSIVLPRFLKSGFRAPTTLVDDGASARQILTECVDWPLLAQVVRIIVRELNRAIDTAHYPNDSTRESNLRHRPMAIGIMGLSEFLGKLLFAVEPGNPNDPQRDFNAEPAVIASSWISEFIYFHALSASCQLAQQHGTYPSYRGSPYTRGLLHQDVWDQVPHKIKVPPSGLCDWEGLRGAIGQHGVRNSLFKAYMPTASTSQIMNTSEGAEPHMDLFTARETKVGTHLTVNNSLFELLVRRNLWEKGVRAPPEDVKRAFVVGYDLAGRSQCAMTLAAARYNDQSNSFNFYTPTNPTVDQITMLFRFMYNEGAKTWIYYNHQKPGRNVSFAAVATTPTAAEYPQCRINDPTCTSCE